MKKSVMIGTSDFQTIINNNGYYIDKSLLIKEVVTNKASVLLIPRPRRFGKTLNMTMLRYFFENSILDKSYLFNSLKINEEKEIMELQGKYPVIYLTFKDIKIKNINSFERLIINLVKEMYREHEYLIKSTNLNNYEKEDLNKYLSGKFDFIDCMSAIKILSKLLFKHNDEKVIFLIDEYDTPIHSAYKNECYEDVIDFMRGFLGSALKDNTYMEKAVITGILRVAKESIFSGLNNLQVSTVIDYFFEDSFGFTEEEVKEILKYYNLEYDINEVRGWYNGYIFGNKVIYNPWSILSFVEKYKRGFVPYWVNTSSNDIIEDLISKGDANLKMSLEDLIQSKTVTKPIREDISLREINENPNNIWSFLLFSGYLKVVNRVQDEYGLSCELKVPNIEVLYLYREIIIKWADKSINSHNFSYMMKCLVNGDIKEFNKIFKDYVIKSMSFFDPSGNESEKVYHAFVLGMLIFLSDSYKVKSNRESGYGRYDIMIIPRERNSKGIVIEFKKFDDEDGSIEEAADNALKQIKDKKYRIELLDEGVTDIIELGIAFKGKDVKMSY
ncbi:MAG: ATP-binding protein [Anaeromicrobium sp.]|uniref:AAA family ATPase n=1 Tax=Anaeromicrobium sp. TaxID=1929132 RepID=UPI0025EE7F52|nr:AAA family ATPase [Anaeromicrobium sp.]MCT4593499.1 ATP-binding protein [Anaeromicrobium sp.]